MTDDQPHSPFEHEGRTWAGCIAPAYAGPTGALPFAELFRDPRRLRSDLRLLRRAVRERWPIPPAARVEIVARLEAATAFLLDADASPEWGIVEARAMRSLVRVLIAMIDASREAEKGGGGMLPVERGCP